MGSEMCIRDRYTGELKKRTFLLEDGKITQNHAGELVLESQRTLHHRHAEVTDVLRQREHPHQRHAEIHR